MYFSGEFSVTWSPVAYEITRLTRARLLNKFLKAIYWEHYATQKTSVQSRNVGIKQTDCTLQKFRGRRDSRLNKHDNVPAEAKYIYLTTN